MGKHAKARADLKAARRNLEQVSSRTKDENAATRAANAKVIAAERALPWYRRV